MAALRAIVVALGILLVALIYSELEEDLALMEEEEKTLEDTSHHYSDVTYTESDKEAFKGISVHDILLTGLSGSFQTPNYPTADHRLDCIWLIRVKPPNTVRLVMMDFDTERDFDFIFIHDGDSTEHPLILIHSGNTKPAPIQSTGHQMLVRFVTNNKVNSRGFQANYYSIPPCFHSVQSSTGIIFSPNYPSVYDSNTHCEWLVSVGRSEIILFEFIDVNTEADFDVIQIYDGESDKAPFLKRISGDRRKQVIFLTTTTNEALVRFTSDSSIAKSGFTAKFTAGSEADLILYFATEYPEFMTSDFHDTMTTMNADGKASESDLGIADVSFFPDVLKAQNVTQQ